MKEKVMVLIFVFVPLALILGLGIFSDHKEASDYMSVYNHTWDLLMQGDYEGAEEYALKNNLYSLKPNNTYITEAERTNSNSYIETLIYAYKTYKKGEYRWAYLELRRFYETKTDPDRKRYYDAYYDLEKVIMTDEQKAFSEDAKQMIFRSYDEHRAEYAESDRKAREEKEKRDELKRQQELREKEQEDKKSSSGSSGGYSSSSSSRKTEKKTIDPSDYDIEAYYEDYKEEFEDEEDAWDDFEDNEEYWDDY